MITDKWKAEEVVRCERSCVYFVENYGWMKHLKLGSIRFTAWDWQVALMSLWQAGKSTITNKSRQVGASWAAVAYFNWLLNFHPDIDLLLLSEKEEKAKKLLGKLTFFYSHLPSWLRARTIADSQSVFGVSIRYYDETTGEWRFANGMASSLTTTGTSGAGESARAILVDEFALMTERRNDEKVWAAIAPTTTHGGQIIILSTPRGSIGEFYRIWGDALQDVVEIDAADEQIKDYRDWNRRVISHARELDMIPTAAHYSMGSHDESWLKRATRGMAPRKARMVYDHFKDIRYDEEWRDRLAKRLKLAKWQIAQEFELEFDQLGNPAFSSADINACWYPRTKHPWVDDMISRSNYYYIGIDSAEGITVANQEPDYNSIVVLNQSGVQVFALHSREHIDEWAGKTVVEGGGLIEVKGTVLKVIERFRPCMVVLEKNAQGLVVQNRIDAHLRDMDDVELLALSMSGGIKPQLVSDFAAEMTDEQAYMSPDGNLITIRKFVFTDYFTVRCLRHYIKTSPGKYEAAQGAFDDPVVALLWAAYGKRIGGALDMVAVLPQERDHTRAIAIDKVDDLTLEEVRADHGPAILPKESDDPMAGIAVNPYADGGVGSLMIPGRSLGGDLRSLEGNDERHLRPRRV